MKLFQFFIAGFFCILSTLAFSQDFNISTNPVLWVRNCVSKHPDVHEILKDDSRDIHISSRFKVSDDGNSLCFEMSSPYNCLRWMRTVDGSDGSAFVPDSDNCHVALFVYSKRTETWNGGIIGSLPTLLLTRLDISKIYSGEINGWPLLKSRLNNDIQMRLCFCKFLHGKWRRSNWAYNFTSD